MITKHKYSKDIQEYIDNAKKILAERYGHYDTTWDLTLSMLGDNLQLYETCWKSVYENGVYNDESKLKNPLLSTLKDSYATVLKISQQLGLTPWSESKIKSPETDETDDFIERLKS